MRVGLYLGGIALMVLACSREPVQRDAATHDDPIVIEPTPLHRNDVGAVAIVEDPPRPRPQGMVTECPTELSGKQDFDRTIGKACGTVIVKADYKVDGGMLVLTAGAKLAFARGAGLQVGYFDDAKLTIEGTASEPVVLTTHGEAKGDRWRGVQLYAKATGSAIAHAVIERAGDNKAALQVEAADVVVVDTTVRETKRAAIEVRGSGAFARFSGNRFVDVDPIALRVSAFAAGTIGSDNAFAADAVIAIDRGVVTGEAAWGDPGVPWLLTGRVEVGHPQVERTQLRIAPGTQVRLRGDGHLLVANGSLVAVGEPQRPITFLPHVSNERGDLRAIAVGPKGQAVIEHATFRDGRSERDGIVTVSDDGGIDLANSRFEGNRVGIALRGDAVTVARMTGVTFVDTPVALDLSPVLFGSLGDDNVYEGEPVIRIAAGTIATDTTWRRQNGARAQLQGKLQIEGAALSIEAGTTLAMKDGASIEVGHDAPASLSLRGTADLPIALVGTRDSAGSWKGIVLFEHARASITHVRLRNAGGTKAAIDLRDQAQADLADIVCEKCSQPIVAWSCASKTTTTNLTATEGTPGTALVPEGCE